MDNKGLTMNWVFFPTVLITLNNGAVTCLLIHGIDEIERENTDDFISTVKDKLNINLTMMIFKDHIGLVKYSNQRNTRLNLANPRPIIF